MSGVTCEGSDDPNQLFTYGSQPSTFAAKYTTPSRDTVSKSVVVVLQHFWKLLSTMHACTCGR